MDVLKRHFDIALETPDGIKKLRELILTLAMQGKLVPQDSKDHPASELLKEIEKEKQKLIKEGKIKKQEPLPPIKPEEILYELPSSWKWVRLGDVSSKIHYGYTASAVHSIRDVRMLRITDIQDNKVNWESVPGCDIKQNDITQYLLNNNDILIARTGGTVGKSFLIKDISVHAVFASYLIRVVPSMCMDVRYLKYFIEGPIYWKQLYEKCSGTGQPNVNGTSLSTLLLTLPPMAEQGRIVAKIDELMALCDKLEAQRDERNQKRLAVHSAAMNGLLGASDSKTFNSSWQFITKHFGELYSVPQNVAELKKAILQLAVMGKLVPRDPKDQPASELLKEILAEKQRFAKGGIIRKQESLSPIKSGESPYELPQGWTWTRLGDISEYIQRGKGPIYSEICDYPVISQKCIQWSGFRKDLVKFIDPDSIKQYSEERIIRQGDLLWNSTGTGTIGRINIYRGELSEYEKVVADSHVTIIRPIGVDNDYVLHFLMSPFVQNEIENLASGTTNQIELNTSTIVAQLVSLPPIEEQKRIVAKINQLMILCDILDKQIISSTNKQSAILNAVLAKV